MTAPVDEREQKLVDEYNAYYEQAESTHFTPHTFNEWKVLVKGVHSLTNEKIRR